MAKASDNQFPKVLLTPLDPSTITAPAGTQAVVLDSTDGNKLKRKDSSGVLSAVGSGFGAYASVTPSLTAVTTNPTLGTGSVAECRYAQDNKTVTGNVYFKFGTSGVAAGSGEYRVSLPVSADTTMTSRTVGFGSIYDASAGDLRVALLSLVNATTAKILFPGTGSNVIVSGVAPWTWAASDEIGFNFTYQAA